MSFPWEYCSVCHGQRGSAHPYSVGLFMSFILTAPDRRFPAYIKVALHMASESVLMGSTPWSYFDAIIRQTIRVSLVSELRHMLVGGSLIGPLAPALSQLVQVNQVNPIRLVPKPHSQKVRTIGWLQKGRASIMESMRVCALCSMPQCGPGSHGLPALGSWQKELDGYFETSAKTGQRVVSLNRQICKHIHL